MSEYTIYTAVHVDDINVLQQELNNLRATSVILSGFSHPLASSENIIEGWQDLTYSQKWVILITKDIDISTLKSIDQSIDLVIHEHQDLWSISVNIKANNNAATHTFLFSNEPSGDVNTKDDWQNIERAKALNDDDLQMMEQVFQLSRDAFSAYLKMGPGMAWDFLR